MFTELKTRLEKNVVDAKNIFDLAKEKYLGVSIDEHSEVHDRFLKSNAFLVEQEKILREFRIAGTRVWLDLETTGLSEVEDDILQIGVAITDDDLNIIATKEWLVPGDVSKCNDFVTNMHNKSGLFHALAMQSVVDGVPLTRAEAGRMTIAIAEEVYEFIIKHCPLDEKQNGTPVFCNNSVQFDDKFLRVQMPVVLDAMHYRRIDVSTMRRVYRDESKGAVDPGKPDCPHKALGDALVCIQEYKDLNADYKAWVISEYLAGLEKTTELGTALASVY